MKKQTSTKRNAEHSMVKWIKDHGFHAELTPDGNVRVSLENRAVSIFEVSHDCHLKEEFMRTSGKTVLILLKGNASVIEDEPETDTTTKTELDELDDLEDRIEQLEEAREAIDMAADLIRNALRGTRHANYAEAYIIPTLKMAARDVHEYLGSQPANIDELIRELRG